MKFSIKEIHELEIKELLQWSNSNHPNKKILTLKKLRLAIYTVLKYESVLWINGMAALSLISQTPFNRINETWKVLSWEWNEINADFLCIEKFYKSNPFQQNMLVMYCYCYSLLSKNYKNQIKLLLFFFRN